MDETQRNSALENTLREILGLLGEDPSREGLEGTPSQWATYLLDQTRGYRSHNGHSGSLTLRQPTALTLNGSGRLMTLFPRIPFLSLCEHHMAPIEGIIHLACTQGLPSPTAIDPALVYHTVDTYARRLQMQERMTRQVANALMTELTPLGIIVVAQAAHYCMMQRGVEQRSSITTTTARRGDFAQDRELEKIFLEHVGMESALGD